MNINRSIDVLLKISHQENEPTVTFAHGESVSQTLLLNGVGGISISHLHEPSEIQQVLYLRKQIDLSAAVAADPLFWDNEKKEMR